MIKTLENFLLELKNKWQSYIEMVIWKFKH